MDTFAASDFSEFKLFEINGNNLKVTAIGEIMCVIVFSNRF